MTGRPEPISLVRFVLDSRPQYEDSGAPLVVHCRYVAVVSRLLHVSTHAQLISGADLLALLYVLSR